MLQNKNKGSDILFVLLCINTRSWHLKITAKAQYNAKNGYSKICSLILWVEVWQEIMICCITYRGHCISRSFVKSVVSSTKIIYASRIDGSVASSWNYMYKMSNGMTMSQIKIMQLWPQAKKHLYHMTSHLYVLAKHSQKYYHSYFFDTCTDIYI